MAEGSYFATRQELHFADRMIRCYRHRPDSVLASFRASVRHRPEADCIVCGSRRFSYRDVDEYVECIAGQLAARGLAAGDRIALLVGNKAEFVLTLLGALRLGAIAVPINVREQGSGIDYILAHCAARAVIHDHEYADRIGDHNALPALSFRFSIGGVTADAEPFDALTRSETHSVEPVIDEEDIAILLYTSGTTGRPKGVKLSHFNLIHSALHFTERMSLDDSDRSVLAVPSSHVTGVAAIILPMLHVGGCVAIMPQFKAPEFLRLAAEERITHAILVPAMYNLCLLRADLSQYELSRWRIGGFGGAPMPESTISKLHEQLPALQLINAYGATETSSPATILPPGDALHHSDSVGIAVECGEVLVMDEEGREVAPGEAGELWIGGPMVVPGYWENPEANEREFSAGYWRSGDIGSKDESGYVRIFDRKKDMINRGGYNVYSVELENLIARHPGVVECAVIAQPDPVLGEKILVFVSHDPNSDEVTETSVAALCAQQLADYKTPDFITLESEPLPRNANGKLMKNELRKRGPAPRQEH